MKNPQFKLVHGTIYLYDGDEMVKGYHRLAFAVDIQDPEEVVRMKYGEEALVQEWHRQQIEKLRAANMLGWASKLIVIAQDNWDLEDINRFLNNSSYIGSWIRKKHPELLG